MDAREMMTKVSELVEKARTAVLATSGKDGVPHMRWMTPGILRSRPGIIFAVTSPRFAKLVDLALNPRVEWMFQTPALDEVVNLRGRINVVDNPSIKSEVLESLGHRLAVFWKECKQSDCVVLETIAEEAVYFRPMKSQHETVKF